jgi:hypothetical protein
MIFPPLSDFTDVNVPVIGQKRTLDASPLIQSDLQRDLLLSRFRRNQVISASLVKMLPLRRWDWIV